MKKLVILFLLTIIHTSSFSQTKNSEIEAIVAEGEHLYQLEMASWNGNDIFLQEYTNKSHIGGYLSYIEKDSATCIFYSKSESPMVIGSVTFDLTFKPEKATLRTGIREFNKNENELYTMRKTAVNAVNNDTLFKVYNNTNLNLIPLNYKGNRKVYILTAPQTEGVVIMGNDYLINFDDNNNITSKKEIHRNIIPITYAANELNTATMHTHSSETGEFITPTDICTLMLYAPFTGWKMHYVVSENYISMWDCVNNELTITTRGAWDQMSPKKKGLKRK